VTVKPDAIDDPFTKILRSGASRLSGQTAEEITI
jgi:hypothetical protein